MTDVCVYIAMAYLAMAYLVMAYLVVAYLVMAYAVMAYVSDCAVHACACCDLCDMCPHVCSCVCVCVRVRACVRARFFVHSVCMLRPCAVCCAVLCVCEDGYDAAAREVAPRREQVTAVASVLRGAEAQVLRRERQHGRAVRRDAQPVGRRLGRAEGPAATCLVGRVCDSADRCQGSGSPQFDWSRMSLMILAHCGQLVAESNSSAGARSTA